MSNMPALTFKDVAKIFKAAGFRENRQNGSHHIFSDESSGISVPVAEHGNQAFQMGTLRAMFEEAGLGSVFKMLQRGCGVKMVVKQAQHFSPAH